MQDILSEFSSFNLIEKQVNIHNCFLLNDIHFGCRSNSVEWLENILSYFYNFDRPYVKSNVKNGDELFLNGDFYDSRQSIDINVLNASFKLIVDLSKILPVNCLIGNHDITRKFDTDVNSLISFKYIPNITVYEKPTILVNNDYRILLLPWVGNYETEEKIITEAKVDYVFAHTDMTGFVLDNGREIKTGVNLFKIKDLKRVFSGHIHKRQELVGGRYIYTGSPYHTKRSDIGNIKGVYKFNPKENSTEFTKNDFSPVFNRIKLEDILEYTLEQVENIFYNNYTDIIIPNKYVHLFNLSKFIDLIKDSKYKKIETITDLNKLDYTLNSLEEGVDIRDILSLLESSIEELGHGNELTAKLKELNKAYYNKINKEDNT